MDAQKVDMYIMANGKYFESNQIPVIRDRMMAADDSKWAMIQSVSLKDPQTALIVSFLGGTLGIDRFFIGDTGLGIAKLLTCGGFTIWAIVDLFMISAAARKKNMEALAPYL